MPELFSPYTLKGVRAGLALRNGAADRLAL